MNWKIYLIILTIFLMGTILVLLLLIGLHYKDKLIKEHQEINNLDDVYEFLKDCQKKPFLDCDLLLKREMELRKGERTVT